jgi:hypothetical protein
MNEDKGDQGESNPFVDYLMEERRKQVEATVYLARHVGLRAGVRPNAAPPEPGDEEYPPVKRVVFIDYPEKTIVWGFTEIGENTAWLDSFPQYKQ